MAFFENPNVEAEADLTQILETPESVAGQGDLFDQDGAYDESNDGSDVEVASIGSSHEEEVSSDDQSTKTTNTDEDNADDNSAAAEELAQFDAKLAMALGTRSAMDDLNAKGTQDSSDEDMNDEQMEAVDEQLEKVFREQKKITVQKTENKDAKEAIVNFKCRVLELLDIYVKQEHTSPLALQLLVPLLEAIRNTKSGLVSGKACDLIGIYFKICRPGSFPIISDPAATLELLRIVHSQAGKEGSNAYSSACSRVSLLLVKILAAKDRENLRHVEALYSQAHESFMLDPKFKVKPSFFSDWLNWSVSARKP